MPTWLAGYGAPTNSRQLTSRSREPPSGETPRLPQPPQGQLPRVLLPEPQATGACRPHRGTAPPTPRASTPSATHAEHHGPRESVRCREQTPRRRAELRPQPVPLTKQADHAPHPAPSCSPHHRSTHTTNLSITPRSGGSSVASSPTYSRRKPNSLWGTRRAQLSAGRDGPGQTRTAPGLTGEGLAGSRHPAPPPEGGGRLPEGLPKGLPEGLPAARQPPRPRPSTGPAHCHRRTSNLALFPAARLGWWHFWIRSSTSSCSSADLPVSKDLSSSGDSGAAEHTLALTVQQGTAPASGTLRKLALHCPGSIASPGGRGGEGAGLLASRHLEPSDRGTGGAL